MPRFAATLVSPRHTNSRAKESKVSNQVFDKKTMALLRDGEVSGFQETPSTGWREHRDSAVLVYWYAPWQSFAGRPASRVEQGRPILARLGQNTHQLSPPPPHKHSYRL